MNKIPKAPALKDPVMLDKILLSIQEELINKIGWLDHAFGRAQKLVTERDKKNHFYPAVYIGKMEYLNVLPGEHLGNRTFFYVNDPQVVEFNARHYNRIESPVSLICWYDLSSIYPRGKESNREDVKRQILRVLTNVTIPGNGKLTINKIYEEAENIFSEFSIKEIETQFLMFPFAGVRFEGSLTFTEDCK